MKPQNYVTKPHAVEAIQFTQKAAEDILLRGEPMPFGLSICAAMHNPEKGRVYSAKVYIRGSKDVGIGTAWIVKDGDRVFSMTDEAFCEKYVPSRVCTPV